MRRSGRPKREIVGADGGPPADVLIGAQIRRRRTLLGLSQGALGDALGVSFQQVQKIENGLNRVMASRLWALSQVLDVPVTYFLETVDGGPNSPEGAAEGDPDAEVMNRRETLELVRAFARIENADAWDSLRAVLHAFAEDRG